MEFCFAHIYIDYDNNHMIHYDGMKHYMCVGSISRASASVIIGRSWVQSLAASYQKTLKGGSCCYPVWRSTFERDRATSIWRCSVAAGPTINWAKRFSISDNKIIIISIITFRKLWSIIKDACNIHFLENSCFKSFISMMFRHRCSKHFNRASIVWTLSLEA